MFKIAIKKNVTSVTNYFLNDSMLTAQERMGRWIGDGAYALGLTQDGNTQTIIQEADLKSALEGKAPPSSTPQWRGYPLNKRYRTNRRCAWDCILAPHKSISVAALCLKEEEPILTQSIEQALHTARDETFFVMESLAKRQVTLSNKTHRFLPTGSLLGAAFTHYTSRYGDPHYHFHLLLMNATRNAICGSSNMDWSALEPVELYKLWRPIDFIFQRELVRTLNLSGINSTLQQVEGMNVATLPAISQCLCARLSKAHQSIRLLVQTEARRTAAERALPSKAWENILNDRHRPSKRGLIDRAKDFSSLLNTAETKEIISSIKEQKTLPTYKTLTSDEISSLVLQSVGQLPHKSTSPNTVLSAAIHAASFYPTESLRRFYCAALQEISININRKEGRSLQPKSKFKMKQHAKRQAPITATMAALLQIDNLNPINQISLPSTHEYLQQLE